MPFSEKTLDFLFENRINDSRTWFAEHRETYQRELIEPLKQLVEALTPTMLEVDKYIVTEPKIDRTICRIWRDTRYTKDPSLYRDYMWIAFKRGAKLSDTDYPSFYFDMSPSGFGYGCGFYHNSTSFMEMLRSMVLDGSKEFKQASKAYRAQDTFKMSGDCYKRPRYADRPEAERDWLERRELSFNAYSKDFPLLFSDNLADFLSEEFRKLFPIYRFLLLVSQKELQRQTELEIMQR